MAAVTSSVLRLAVIGVLQPVRGRPDPATHVMSAAFRSSRTFADGELGGCFTLHTVQVVLNRPTDRVDPWARAEKGLAALTTRPHPGDDAVNSTK